MDNLMLRQEKLTGLPLVASTASIRSTSVNGEDTVRHEYSQYTIILTLTSGK
jgi:hypothetical protein